MKIDFILRNPGQHQIVGTEDMDAVPREGECVEIGGDIHVVHSVIWVPSEKLVQVLINP